MKKEPETKKELEKQYFTPNGVNVTARIKDGRTIIEHDMVIAEIVARNRRSYVYSVADSRNNFVGYGIPK